MTVIAEAAAMLAASVGVAIIAAAPSTADPLYDLCTLMPAEDPCHVVFNVPVDPSIPHRPPSDGYNPVTDPTNPLDPSNPANPNNSLNPMNPANPANPNNPNNASNPANPSSPLHPHS